MKVADYEIAGEGHEVRARLRRFAIKADSDGTADQPRLRSRRRMHGDADPASSAIRKRHRRIGRSGATYVLAGERVTINEFGTRAARLAGRKPPRLLAADGSR